MADSLRQNDFSGGINIVGDPVKLAQNELSDARNFVIDKTDLRQRYGFSQYNSSAIGASTGVRSAFQFKNLKGDRHLVVQADDGVIYLGSAAVPTSGSFSALLTETAGSQVACFTEIDHKLIMTNGVDKPQVYEGTYGKCEGFSVCRNGTTADVPIINAKAITDHELDVVDEDTATYATLGALTTIAAHGDRIYIGSKVPTLTGFRLVFGTGAVVNTNAVTLTIRKFTGAAWATVGTISDGTLDAATSTKTFNRTGDITFAAATTEATLLGSQYRYWFMITLSGALSATVQLTAAYLMYPMQALPLLWNGTFQYPSQFSKTVDAGTTFTDYTANVIDSDTDTVATLSSLDTYANGDYFLVGYSTKFSAIYMQIKTVNTIDSVLTAEYWNGSSWQSLAIHDGTQQSLNGKTLSNIYINTMEEICFVPPASWLPTFVSSLETSGQYLLRFKVSVALSADVTISEVRVIPYLTPLPAYKFCLGHKDSLFLGSPVEETNRIDVSAEGNINDFDGADSDSLIVPSNLSLTALSHFYNEVFVSTPEEVFLLQGYSPSTFSFLRIETDQIGSLSQSSVVSWGKTLFFVHSNGFYAFDGTGVQNISKDKVNHFFDSTNSTYFIPLARLPYVQGRWNPIDKVVEWTISKGASQATNNFILTFNPEKKAWMFHDFVACSMMNLVGSNGETQAYHGDYEGRIHRANVAALDNSTAITSYFSTRGLSDEKSNVYSIFRGLQLRTKGQDAGTLAVSYAINGNSSFTTYASLSLVSANSFVWCPYYNPLAGLSLILKFTNTTTSVTPVINELIVPYSPIREETSFESGNTGDLVAAVATIPVGLWIDARSYSTLELADAAAYAAGKLLVISQNYTLTANTTLTADVFVFPGGSFTKASTYTLTFSGSFENPSNGHCFIGFDAGDVTGLKEPRPEYWATNTTPGTTDMALAFQSALKCIETTGGMVDLGSNTYRLTTLSGQSDATSIGVVGIDPSTEGLSFKIKGDGAKVITATNTTALTNIDMIFFRASGSLEVSGIRFQYDGGASAKVQRAIHWGVGGGYALNVHDCIFTDFFQSIVADSVVSKEECTVKITNNQFRLLTGLDGIWSEALGPVAQAIHLNTGWHAQVTNNYYNGCVTTAGVTVWGDGLILSSAYGNVISNNIVTNYANEGIYITRNTDYGVQFGNSIKGNLLKGTQPTSVGIRADSPNTIVSNNTIMDCQAGIYIWIADTGVYTGYFPSTVNVTNNIITMKETYVSSRSIGITLYGYDIICKGNQITWPISNVGYGSTASHGIFSYGMNQKIADNVMINYMQAIVFAGGITGSFVAGQTISGGTSGAISTLSAVGSTYALLLHRQIHPNNNSFAEFVVGETVTSSGGGTVVITSVQYPTALVYGIGIVPHGPVNLSNNRTANLAGGIYIDYSAATKNGPIEILSHSSEKDANYIVCDPLFSTLPDPGLRFIQKHQEAAFKVSATIADWHRIMEAQTELSGILTITQDHEFVGKWMISYVVGATTAGAITLIQQSTRDTNYIDAIRIGTVTGQEIGLDIKNVAGAQGLVFQLDFETTASNNFLLMDVSAGVTLKAPAEGVAAPGTDLISWP